MLGALTLAAWRPSTTRRCGCPPLRPLLVTSRCHPKAVSKQVIGIDVGGTKVSVASLSDAGLGSPRIIPTEAGGEQALIDEIVRGRIPCGVPTPRRSAWECRRWSSLRRKS